MPEPLRRPEAVEPSLSPRDKLRQAIERLNEEQARVNALAEGAQGNLWSARAQLTTAQADLDRVRHANRQDLAYNFVEGKPRDTAEMRFPGRLAGQCSTSW
jgi:hypothetical protein